MRRRRTICGGFTADLSFPSGYESAAGRVVKILYPLPREGALAGSEAVCKALGGTHTAGLDVCTGYSASSDHAPYVSDALQDPFAPAPPPDDLSSRGACTWSAEWWIASAYYSCESAFAQARACNLANKAAKDNGSCAEAECGAGEFALGGKCLALSASGGRLEHAPTGAGNALPAGFACDCDGDDANGFAGDGASGCDGDHRAAVVERRRSFRFRSRIRRRL